MKESRSLDELLPYVRDRATVAIAQAEKDTGLKLIVTCTYRDDEQQRAYYEQGRTKPGRVVTNDPGPGGAHSLRIALDVAPAIRDWKTGKLSLFYATTKWDIIAAAFRKQGFSWGGDWVSIKDKPHFQLLPPGKTLREFRTLTEEQRKECYPS